MLHGSQYRQCKILLSIAKHCAACDHWLTDEVFWGEDLQELSSIDRNTCLGSCKATAGCGAVSFDTSTCRCWLKVVLPASTLSRHMTGIHSMRICSTMQQSLLNPRQLAISNYVRSCPYICVLDQGWPVTTFSPSVRLIEQACLVFLAHQYFY